MSREEGLTSRLKSRMKSVREQALEKIVADNKMVKTNLDKALPELESSLQSNPTLLRLIREVYSYVEKDAEVLSQVIGDVKAARRASDAIDQKANTAIADIAGTETMIMARKVYDQREVPTITEMLDGFEMAALDQALDNLSLDRLLELYGQIELARQRRSK